MKLVTNMFKSGGLYEKHLLATSNFGNHLSICIWTKGNQFKHINSFIFMSNLILYSEEVLKLSMYNTTHKGFSLKVYNMHLYYDHTLYSFTLYKFL